MAQKIKRRVGSTRPPGTSSLGFGGIRNTSGARLRSRFVRSYLSLVDAMRRDLERGGGFPWLIVCYACGIWLYFELPREPQLWATLPLALAMSVAATTRRRRGHAAFVMLALTAIAAGLAIADLRTWLVATPRLTAERTHTINGWVEAVEPRAVGYRLSVRPTKIRGLEMSAMPVRIRVTGRAQPTPVAGEAVRFRARLSPPQGPVLPGGYAFDRAAFYEQVGAYGFIFGRVERDGEQARTRPLSIRLKAALASLRARIGERIRETYGGDSGAIAAALIVGERGAVSEEAQEDLRIAGLAHVLAISGMHMALVAGVVFFVIRAGLALSPTLALSYPIRSWAAGGALAAATLYLAISGGSIATQRAYVMAAVVFLSMIAGRPAVTMRSVALAAAIVLTLAPESLLQPGFQMSFSAVIALIAAYRALFEARRRRQGERQAREIVGRSMLRRGMRLAVLWGAGLVMTSLIAGLATGPVALTHFYRSSPLGLIANVAAMPLVSLIIMPLAVVSLVTMPYGLDPLPLYPMQAAIDAMLAIAAKIADWTPGGGVIGAIGDAPAILFTGGLLWMALWSSRWRYLGIAPVCLAVLVGAMHESPDMIVSEDGRTIALRGRDGHLALDIGSGGKFGAEIWLRSDGDAAELKIREVDGRMRRCDAEACIYTIAAPREPPLPAEAGAEVVLQHRKTNETDDLVAGLEPGASPASMERNSGLSRERDGEYERGWAGKGRMLLSDEAPYRRAIHVSRVIRPEAFAEDCIRADIVVTALAAPANCADHAIVIDRAFLKIHGATALYWRQTILDASAVTGEPPGLQREERAAKADATRDAKPFPTQTAPPQDLSAETLRSVTAKPATHPPPLPLDRIVPHIATARSAQLRPWQMRPAP
ncbi:ComEC/Rec2 family competence protein [Breoghania sp.]|uniref:ComEC/Rec2 family competence protein n=1 Tax=Breoghania sp. TaxID=2065378 RepID=UPI002AA8FE77|nr:ComEC/Rec2 family competence protein [Breoghania sp.]